MQMAACSIQFRKLAKFARSDARERLQVKGGNHDIVPIAEVKSVSWPRGNRS
jgi:hypothetical protein